MFWRKNKMVFIVCVNGEQTRFDDPQEANEFAMNTGLGFPDVIIIDTDLDDVEKCTRFTQ